VDLGRWLQRDPAGYVDGANLYEYVMSSPVDMLDRMGLASGVVPGIGGGCGNSVGSGCGGGPLPLPDPGEPQPPAEIQPPDLCDRCLHDALRDPRVAGLLDTIRSNGCPVTLNCENCDSDPDIPPKWKGYAKPITGEVGVCRGRHESCASVLTTVLHELMHLHSFCNSDRFDKWNCCTCVCEELRAYRFDGGCRDGGSRRQPGETELECLRRRTWDSCKSACPYEAWRLVGSDPFDTCWDAAIANPDCLPLAVPGPRF